MRMAWLRLCSADSQNKQKIHQLYYNRNAIVKYREYMDRVRPRLASGRLSHLLHNHTRATIFIDMLYVRVVDESLKPRRADVAPHTSERVRGPTP